MLGTIVGVLAKAPVPAKADHPLWSSGWFVITLAVISVLGVAGTFWFGFRPRQVRGRLRYLVENTQLVGPPLMDGVQVIIDGESVNTVTASLITIVNSGAATVRGSDLRSVVAGIPDGLALTFDPVPDLIARARVQSVTEPYCKPAVVPHGAPAEGRLSVTFDVLEPKDSFTVVLLHNGSPDCKIVLEGHLVNGDIVTDGEEGAAEFALAVAKDLTVSASFIVPGAGIYRMLKDFVDVISNGPRDGRPGRGSRP